MVSGQPWTNPSGQIIGSSEGPVPVVRLYGVTTSGASIMLSVHGFTPYLYVALPQSANLTPSYLGAIRNTLDHRVCSLKVLIFLISVYVTLDQGESKGR